MLATLTEIPFTLLTKAYVTPHYLHLQEDTKKLLNNVFVHVHALYIIIIIGFYRNFTILSHECDLTEVEESFTSVQKSRNIFLIHISAVP